MRAADQFILNVLSNYGRLAVEILAALVVTPIVVRDIGRSGFGVAALILAGYTAFRQFSESVGRALQRHIPQDLASGDPDRVKRTFSTGLAGFVLIGVVGAGLMLAVHDWLLSGAELDASEMADGRLAFGLLIVWLALAFPGFAYQWGLHAIQRYDVEGVITGVTTLVRSVSVIVLFTLGYGSVTLYVGAQLFAWLAVWVSCRWALHRLTPGLAESWRFVDRRAARALGAFSAMGVVMVLGLILGNQGFRIYIGKGLGMDELGGLAAVLTLTGLPLRLMSNVTGVLVPTVSGQDARGERANVAKLLASGAKYAVAVGATVCLVPIPVASPFLTLWLGDEFSGLGLLLVVLLIIQIPRSLGSTSQAVLMGLGRLKVVTPILLAQGVVSLLAAAAYVEWIDASLTGAAICCFAIQGVARFMLFIYSCRQTAVPLGRVLLDALARPVVMGLLGALTTWAVAAVRGNDQWWKLVGSVFGGEIVFVALVLLAGLTSEERQRLLSFVVRARLRLGGAVRGCR